MPLYEYVCGACGKELERLQKISDPPLSECPSCQQPELVKKVSAAAFRLKGSGWYETDFKQGKRRNVIGDNDKGENKSSESKSSEKSSETSKSDGKQETTSQKKGSNGKKETAKGAAAAG